jgi:hypothetical protein
MINANIREDYQTYEEMILIEVIGTMSFTKIMPNMNKQMTPML